MLIAYRQIHGSSLRGIEETVGHITDLFFDGETWQVRYIVADTGKWLPGRKVLLPPAVFNACDWGAGIASLSLTRQQVKASPDIDTLKPVSRQMEFDLFRHYNVPMYWGPAGAAVAGGAGAVPSAMDAPPEPADYAESSLPNLRSADAVKGYYIHAADGDIGHVKDFVIDDDAWVIRYLAIDTKNWLPARKVLVSPQWIESISWTDASVAVNLKRETIKQAPEYDPNQPVNRADEEQLYDYYGRKKYWLPETT